MIKLHFFACVGAKACFIDSGINWKLRSLHAFVDSVHELICELDYCVGLRCPFRRSFCIKLTQPFIPL